MRLDQPMPDVSIYLSKARDHVRTGEKLLQVSDYEGARLYFERAEADAETALALARAREAEAEARIAEEQIAVLEGRTAEVTR